MDLESSVNGWSSSPGGQELSEQEAESSCRGMADEQEAESLLYNT